MTTTSTSTSSTSTTSTTSTSADAPHDVPAAHVDDAAAVRLLGQTWGARVSATRRRLGLTQHQLSLAAGVRQQTVSKIERGELVPLDRLKWRLALALGCSPDGLWAWPPLAPPLEPPLEAVPHRGSATAIEAGGTGAGA